MLGVEMPTCLFVHLTGLLICSQAAIVIPAMQGNIQAQRWLYIVERFLLKQAKCSQVIVQRCCVGVGQEVVVP